MLLGTLGASVLGKTLTSNVANRTVDIGKKMQFFRPNPWWKTSFLCSVKKQLEQVKFWPKWTYILQCLFTNNLPKLWDAAYLINLDEYDNSDTHWTVLRIKYEVETHFHSFGLGHVPEEIKNL